jgi:hypothetical protein
MDLLRELRITHRRCGHHVKLALNLGLLPLFLCGMLIYARGGQAAPQLWLVAGISLGHWMILWSAYRMHSVTLRRSRLGTRLVENSNAWFPYLQIGIHGGVAAALIFLFWFTLCDLGMPSTLTQHLLLLALLIMWPIRRSLRFTLHGKISPSWETGYVFLSYFHWIVFTLFASLTLTGSLVPEDQNRSASFPMMAMLIWVPAVLIILILIVLFLDHVFRKSTVEQAMVPRDRMD